MHPSPSPVAPNPRPRVALLLPLLAMTLLTALRAPAAAPATDAPTSRKPVLLYSRHFNAAGESRYLPEGTYREILARLRTSFVIQVHDRPLNAETLRGVDVVLIANPSDRAVGTNPPPPHFRPPDIDAISRHIEAGGGLVLLGNQENHNLELDDTNRLLARFGLQFANIYTDAKALQLPRQTPIIGGLRWAYYTGNQVQLTPGHPARPRALVSNDLAQKPAAGTRDAAGILLATAEPGRGRVIVATDAGWLTDDALSGRGIGGVAIRDHDNEELCRRLLLWAAQRPAR